MPAEEYGLLQNLGKRELEVLNCGKTEIAFKHLYGLFTIYTEISSQFQMSNFFICP